jgi:glycosyltransferase involved in cell wall biosynthesis
MVLGEAQAYSLPVVATDTGGIGSMVAPSSGATFRLEAFTEDAAAFVARAWADPALYADLSRNSRAVFDDRHNWAAAARTVVGSLEAALQSKG